MSKFIFSRKTSDTSMSGRRSSRIISKFSLRRHGSRGGGRSEGDRVRLVGGEEVGVGEEEVGQRDVMSETEIQNVKVKNERKWFIMRRCIFNFQFQLASLKRKRESLLVSWSFINIKL